MLNKTKTTKLTQNPNLQTISKKTLNDTISEFKKNAHNRHITKRLATDYLLRFVVDYLGIQTYRLFSVGLNISSIDKKQCDNDDLNLKKMVQLHCLV